MADNSLPQVWLDEKLKARFWAKVDIRGPWDCWEWKAAKYKNGYGAFSVFVDGKWRPRGAHRIAWEISRERDLSGGSTRRGDFAMWIWPK